MTRVESEGVEALCGAFPQALHHERPLVHPVPPVGVEAVAGARADVAAQQPLPEGLADKPYLKEFYGHVGYASRAYFAGTLGWFDGNATNLLAYNIWRKGFFENQLGYAAALSVIMILIATVLALVLIRLMSSQVRD